MGFGSGMPMWGGMGGGGYGYPAMMMMQNPMLGVYGRTGPTLQQMRARMNWGIGSSYEQPMGGYGGPQGWAGGGGGSAGGHLAARMGNLGLATRVVPGHYV